MKTYYYFVENERYVRVMADEKQHILPLTILKTKLVRNISANGLIKIDLGLIKNVLSILEAGVDNKTIKQSLSFLRSSPMANAMRRRPVVASALILTL